MKSALALIDKPPKPTLQTEDTVYVTTIMPKLAAEIGLNESILLRQIAHWIKTSNNLREGQWWTFQSLQEMHKDAFPYWSIATISRTAKKLVDMGLIDRTNRYNKRRNDSTFWYALNIDGLAKLKSITVVLQNEKGIVTESIKPLQDANTDLQNAKRLEPDVLQNETTLPEVSLPEVSQKEKDSAPVLSLQDKLSGQDYAEFINILKTRFKVTGETVNDIYHQLRGTTKKKTTLRYQYGATFREKPVSLDELKAFPMFYRRQVTDTTIPIPTSAQKLENWFGKLRTETAQVQPPSLHEQMGVTRDDFALPDLYDSPFDLKYDDGRRAG